MRIVAVVPMKLNNTRLPQKNTKRFTNGEPLCTYVLNTLLSIDIIEKVYVYCSNPRIKDYIPDKTVFVQRSEWLDQDSTKMNEVLRSFTDDVKADIYVMSHVTSPFISAESIISGLHKVLGGEYDSAFSAKRVQDFLWMNGEPFNYDPENIPRTQDLPELYQETSGFYIYRYETMKDHNRRIGINPYIVEVGEIEGIDIDEIEDYEIADAVYNHIIFKKRGIHT